MGLFDFLKKGRKQEDIGPVIPETNEPKDKITMYMTEEGRSVFEFCEGIKKPGKMYDTTRLIVDKEPEIIDQESVYACRVSWYGEDDTIFEGRTGRADQYSCIIAGIDPELMKSDVNYQRFVMTYLVEKNRVERYLRTSLMTEEIAEAQREEMASEGRTHTWECGNYIGGVQRRESGQFGARFNQTIGKIMHNTVELKNRRTMQQKQKAKIAARNAKRAELAKLEAEINGISQEEWMH